MDIRRQERVRLIYHLRVFDAHSGTLLGQLLDINSEGIMLIGEHPIEAGKAYLLRMDLPRNVMSDRHLKVEADCIWSKPDSTGDFYIMGFRLRGVSEAALEIVGRLARDFYQQVEGDDSEIDEELGR